MKTGTSLQELEIEVERRRHAKKDFLVNTQALHMWPRWKSEDERYGGAGFKLSAYGQDLAADINHIAHRQIAKAGRRLLTRSPSLSRAVLRSAYQKADIAGRL